MGDVSPRTIVEHVALLKLAYATSATSPSLQGTSNGWSATAVANAFAADSGFAAHAGDYSSIVVNNYDLLSVDRPTANAPIALIAVRDRRTGVILVLGDGLQLGNGLAVAIPDLMAAASVAVGITEFGGGPAYAAQRGRIEAFVQQVAQQNPGVVIQAVGHSLSGQLFTQVMYDANTESVTHTHF